MCRQIYSNLQLDFSVGFHSVLCYILIDPLLGRGVESRPVGGRPVSDGSQRGQFCPTEGTWHVWRYFGFGFLLFGCIGT